MKPKKIVPGVMLGMCMMQPVWANHVSYKAPRDLCGSNSDLSCHKDDILPKNANGSLQSSTKKHEWAPVFGHVYGYSNVIEVRFRFEQDAIDILKHRHDGWQPFGFEIDMTERKLEPPYAIDFDNLINIEFSCTPCSKEYMDSLYGVKDTSILDRLNTYKNGHGYLIRDASKLKAGIDYVVRFILNDPLPVDGVSVIPNFQIAHHVDGYMGVFATKPNESPFFFYVLETDVFEPEQDWKLYRNGKEGLRWDDKESSRKDNRFVTIPGWPYASNNYDLDKGKRLDYFDKVCRQVNPNPIVEQFRNTLTGNITMYKTPINALGQRYANANCDVGAFALPSYLDGDGSGTGATSGTAVSSKPNLVAIDTFVTTGESASSTRLTQSSKTFLGTPIWCQMRTKNSGAANAGAFDSECVVSTGKKFDGWSDAKSLGYVRTKSLAKGGATNTEHKGIDILFYPNWYNVVFRVDPKNAVAETIETDNSYNKDSPFAFQIWGRPNVVASVSADKASYTLSETISANASFANTGINPYGKTGYVDWYVDGSLLSEQDRIQREKLHPGVSGKTETVSFLAPQSYGVHEIKACFRYAVDDLVEEVQPADNCFVNTFSIPDPSPPVIIVAPLPPPPPDTTGTTGGGGGTSVYTPPTLPLITSCPQAPDPDFNAIPTIQSGDVGTVIFGNNKQRLFLPVATLVQAKTSFVWNGFAAFDPSLVTRICFNSADTNWGVTASTACADTFTLQGPNFVVDIPNTPQASKGTWSFKQGTTEYWVNPSTITDLTLDTGGHIRYGEWTPNTVTVSEDASGMMLNTAFSSKVISGFWIPTGAVPNGKVFWNNDQDNYPGMPGQLSCDANGKLRASIANVAPGSTGRMLLGLTDATQFGWQTTDQYILPAGAFIVNANGDYKLPLSASPFQKREVTYDKGQQKLTLTVNGDSRMLTSFYGITDISHITKTAYFDAWIAPTGQATKLIQGTAARSLSGIWTIVFTGLPPEFGGNAYLTLTDGTKSWQSVATFAFGSGILVDVSVGDYAMPK